MFNFLLGEKPVPIVGSRIKTKTSDANIAVSPSKLEGEVPAHDNAVPTLLHRVQVHPESQGVLGESEPLLAKVEGKANNDYGESKKASSDPMHAKGSTEAAEMSMWQLTQDLAVPVILPSFIFFSALGTTLPLVPVFVRWLGHGDAVVGMTQTVSSLARIGSGIPSGMYTLQTYALASRVREFGIQIKLTTYVMWTCREDIQQIGFLKRRLL